MKTKFLLAFLTSVFVFSLTLYGADGGPFLTAGLSEKAAEAPEEPVLKDLSRTQDVSGFLPEKILIRTMTIMTIRIIQS